MGDKIDPKAKERSDSINNKIKWPFVIFFVIAIFVAISIVARVNQDKFNDLYTPALYLFSTIAQTMGALLGIGLALLYTALSNLKPNNIPAFEPAKKLLIKDNILINSIYFGLSSIASSVIGLFFIAYFVNLSNEYYIIVLIILLISILFALISIICILKFSIYRYNLYMNPISLYESIFLKNNDIKINVPYEIFLECITIPFITKNNHDVLLNKYKVVCVIIKYNGMNYKTLMHIINLINKYYMLSTEYDNNELFKIYEVFIDCICQIFIDKKLDGYNKVIYNAILLQKILEYMFNEPLLLLYKEKLLYLYLKRVSQHKSISINEFKLNKSIYYIIYRWFCKILNINYLYDMHLLIPESVLKYDIINNYINYIQYNIIDNYIQNTDKKYNKTKTDNYIIDILFMSKMSQIEYYTRRHSLKRLTHDFINIVNELLPRIERVIIDILEINEISLLNGKFLKYRTYYREYLFIVLFLSRIVINNKDIIAYDSVSIVNYKILYYFYLRNYYDMYQDIPKTLDYDLKSDLIDYFFKCALDADDIITKIEDNENYVIQRNEKLKKLRMESDTFVENQYELQEAVQWVPGSNNEDIDAHLK